VAQVTINVEYPSNALIVDETPGRDDHNRHQSFAERRELEFKFGHRYLLRTHKKALDLIGQLTTIPKLPLTRRRPADAKHGWRDSTRPAVVGE
jgi:hypothetical protein